MNFLKNSRESTWVVAILLVLVVLASVALGGGRQPVLAAEIGRSVTIPNFWDPKRRIERPAAGAVQAIRFVTTDDYPPFNFLDADGHLTGFNVDLARAICAELGVRCTIQARPWDNLVATLEEGRADAAIAGIAVTAEARNHVDFSDVYLRSPARFVVRRDGPSFDISPEGLKGHTLAVVGRTSHEAYLAAFFPEVERKIYPDADAAREALKSGAVDAHFGDGVQLSFWLTGESAGGCCVFAGGPYLETHFFGEGMSVAVRKDAPDLKRAIDSALETIHDKGTYAELYLRYFPVSFY
jgi:polar amino acid transport system substrate-binding protein